MRKPAFERKIPVNPKYASIQSGIDTGATAKKAAPVLSDQQVSKRRNELFRRIRPAKCFDIIKSIEEGEEVESVYDLVPQTVSTSSSPDDAVSVYQSLLRLPWDFPPLGIFYLLIFAVQMSTNSPGFNLL